MMDSRLFVLLLAGFVLGGIMGCTSDPPAPSASSAPDNRSLEYGTPPSSDTLDLRPVDLEATSDLWMAFNRFARHASWQTAHRRVQSHLDYTSVTDLPRSVREQTAAYAMLTHHFTELDSSPSAAKQEAVAHYITLLIENHSPESALTYPAVTLLETHWSDERLASALDTLLRHSRDTYVIHSAGTDPHIPDMHADIRRANQALREFRASLQAQ